jgi:hypothetical protein
MTALDYETKTRAFVTEAGSDRLGGPLYVVGNDIQVKISSADTGGAFAVMEDHTPPSGSRHTFQNVGTQPSRHIVTVVPGGLDVFFQEMSETFPRGTELDPPRLARIFAKHDLELPGPPLAARTETK